jgi:hypothetical protein
MPPRGPREGRHGMNSSCACHVSCRVVPRGGRKHARSGERAGVGVVGRPWRRCEGGVGRWMFVCFGGERTCGGRTSSSSKTLLHVMQVA